LVDGKFIESQKDLALLYRGSKNQRLIDIVKTRMQNKVVVIL
jgi:anaerobic ribonucleoside-triphosphate reductase activating protein